MSGRHEWIDPASAGRCCTCRYERILVSIREIPEAALPDGRVYCTDPELVGLVFVWIPRRIPRPRPHVHHAHA